MVINEPFPKPLFDPQEPEVNSNFGYEDTSGISDVMKENFKKILRNNPHGVWSAELPSLYEKLTGYEFDLRELGYYSLLELVDALPQIFRRVRPEGCKSDWQLFDATVPENSRMSNLANVDNCELHNSYISDVIFNIRRILQANPEGVYLDDFIHLYSLNCDASLLLSKLNCDSIEKFLLQVADRVPLKFNYSNARKKVQYAYTNLPGIVRPPVSRASFAGKVPDDAVLPGQLYEWQTPSDNSDGYFPIRIGTVVDPSLIWIQLEGKLTTEALDVLMNELDEFYTSPAGDDYVMADHHIAVGTICAGIWSGDGSWHRISILGVGSVVDDVNAAFVDYGTRAKVKRSQLRYLRNAFISLPAQAIKSQMAFVKPVNGNIWDPRVRERLLACCRNKILMAEIVQKPPFVDRVSLWICDISKSEDVHLSMLLVKENLAVYCEENSVKPSDNSPEKSGFSVPQNFATPSTSANLAGINQDNLGNVISSFLRAMASTSSVLGENFVERMLYSPNAHGSNSTLSAVLQHLISSGMDLASIVRLLELSKPSPLSGSPFSNSAGLEAAGVVAPSDAVSSFLNTANVQPSQMNPNLFNSLHSTPVAFGNSYPVRVEPPVPPHQGGYMHDDLRHTQGNSCVATKSTAVCNKAPVELSTSARNMSPFNSSDDNDSPEVFEDDDDDEFEQFCNEHVSKVERFVKRVNLRGGYRFHIIVVKHFPYVSCGDISNLLWCNEDSDSLSRRLCGKEITFPTMVISDDDYPEIFSQLYAYNVKGMQNTGEKMIATLYMLKNLIDILNIFGHPSLTIRSEIMKEIHSFDSSDALWKSFSSLEITDEPDENESISETDSDKFYRLCIFDLKSTLEALRFRRLKIMNGLTEATDVYNPVEQLKKIEKQYKVYERRIKEIEEIIKSDK